MSQLSEREQGGNTDEGKSGSGKDFVDLVNNGAVEVQSFARSSSPDLLSSPSIPDPYESKPESALSEVLNLIIQTLEKDMDRHTETIYEIKQNRECINSLKKDVKQDIVSIKEINKEQQKRISELEEKLEEAQRYQKQCNLWLYGLQEEEGENVKDRVIAICHKVVPEAADSFTHHIDIVHRVGKKSEDKVRPVILKFIARSTKELLWKNCKRCAYLRSEKLYFEEELTKKDLEERNKLWPQIEAARKEGKTAFFVGAKAIIDGKEIDE